MPDFAAARFNHANTLLALGRLEAALAGYEQALKLQPNLLPAHQNRARTLLMLDRPEAAMAACAAGLAVVPQDHLLWTARGDALQELGRPAEALPCYDRALAQAPGDPWTLTNRGNTLLALGDVAAAMAHFDAAIAANPSLADAHYNRARALQDRGETDAALQGYAHALAAQPDHVAARWNQSMCRLLAGDFVQGWPERWGWGQVPERPFPMPRWTGEPLQGHSILLHVDQGLGDTLQFCRFATAVAAQGAQVVLEVQDGLVKLLRSLRPGFAVVAQGAPLPPCDFHVSLMDVPRLLGVTVATIPAEIPYLHADPAPWRARLDALPGCKVGLVWAGSPRLDQKRNARLDERRSIRLAGMAALAGVDGVQFISLQKGPAADQAATPPPGLVLHDWTDALEDFADTASLVAGLDLVISVDTSVAHLAGALGVPIWLLNRQDTCWRWLLGRDDSPWYPTLRQFRQAEAGDWESVMTRVAQALAAFPPPVANKA
jgi:Tfp pilus assembly protein PilF